MGSIILRQRNLNSALKLAFDYLGVTSKLRKDPFLNTIGYMLSVEQRYGFKSSFYFMTGGESRFDARYSVDNPRVVDLIQNIERQGCEVGLHPSYYSYDDLDKMAAEKERLDKIVSDKNYGCRQHNLRWRTPDTWRIQERLGILYDTTLSFADHAGFRCGICLPFKPFDAVEKRPLNIWELPLTVMEASLQRPEYQGLSPAEAYRIIIQHIETVKRYHGVFVLLWHNSSFDTLGEWAGWKEVYEKVMKYIAEQSAFVASGRQIILEFHSTSP